MGKKRSQGKADQGKGIIHDRKQKGRLFVRRKRTNRKEQRMNQSKVQFHLLVRCKNEPIV